MQTLNVEVSACRSRRRKDACKRSLQEVRLTAGLRLPVLATVFPFERAPLHVLTKAQETGHGEYHYDGGGENKKAEPIKLNKPKRSVSFKPTPRSDHLDGRAQHIAEARE